MDVAQAQRCSRRASRAIVRVSSDPSGRARRQTRTRRPWAGPDMPRDAARGPAARPSSGGCVTRTSAARRCAPCGTLFQLTRRGRTACRARSSASRRREVPTPSPSAFDPTRPTALAGRDVRARAPRLRLGDAAARRVDELVLAALDEAAQAVERVPDVDVARVERRDAEPDRVRAAEVRDDVRALDQRAADRPRLAGGASETCEPRRAGSRGEPRLEAERREPLVVERDDQLGQARSTSRGARSMPASAVSVTPSSTAASARIGGVPARKRPMPVDRVVVALHRELVALAEPAPDRRAQPRLAARRATYR